MKSPWQVLALVLLSGRLPADVPINTFIMHSISRYVCFFVATLPRSCECMMKVKTVFLATISTEIPPPSIKLQAAANNHEGFGGHTRTRIICRFKLACSLWEHQKNNGSDIIGSIALFDGSIITRNSDTLRVTKQQNNFFNRNNSTVF